MGSTAFTACASAIGPTSASGHMVASLKLVVNVTENGKTSAKSRTYGKVKSDAADEAVYNVADALAGLQEHPVNRITRVDETELSETV